MSMSQRRKSSVLAIAVGAAIAVGVIAAPASPSQALPVVSTDWMANAGYGVALHWTTQSVPAAGGSPAAFCTAVNNFDVNLLASQLQAAGAGYLLFTISHAQMHLPFPSAKLDSVISGRTCSRDLPLDMYNALTPLGIKLMFYFPSIATSEDPTWQASSQWNTSKPNFAQLQYDLVTEIGNRYGTKLAGWWVDNSMGAYTAIYNHATYATALRAGNPNRVISFNFSSVGTWNSSLGAGVEDYQAGESDDLSRLPASRYSGEGGTQWQTFSYLDDFWVHATAGTPVPRYSNNKISLYAKSVINAGGVLTLNAAPYQDGLISAATLSQLQALRASTRSATGDTVVLDDRSLSFGSGWSQISGNSYHLNSGTYTQAAGSSVSQTFTGTGVTWYAPKGPDHGRADVRIDGGSPVTVDLYSAAREDVATAFTATGLSAGSHTISITSRADKNAASTNTYVEVDAIEYKVGARTDDTGASVTYSSGWATSSIAALYGGSSHYTLTAGSNATFAFNGTNVTWYTVKAPDHGKVDISIDGGAAQIVDLYQTQWTGNTAAFSISGLSSGAHTIKITARSDKNAASSNYYVEVDGFQQRY
ncbi:hypothetical protein IWX81_001731 [Salinibacterium sp. CAN_S4]|uniref:alpha-L-fucosidase n=1 Tax=Salinibacterium sp. CAN_S4 TaxID=2787727 RepID=UPI0018EFE72E